MEETPKVHNSQRSQRHQQQQQQRRQPQQHSSASSSRHRQRERERERRTDGAAVVPTTTIAAVQLAATTASAALGSDDTLAVIEGSEYCVVAEQLTVVAGGGESTRTATQSSSQPTVVLVNGRLPSSGELDGTDAVEDDAEHAAPPRAGETEQQQQQQQQEEGDKVAESPTLEQQAAASSRNSSGDAMSLRETLQQLPASTVGAHHHHHHHHHQHRPRLGRQASPQVGAAEVLDSSFHRGILGYMDRELKQSAASPTPSALSVGGTAAAATGSGGSSGGGSGGVLRKLQSLSDPQASPAQRSIRSRSSLEKSPRRKRSKSESRRRRERKLIAAGEMEVRQANETLMRYLKQCSEMNDASLSGELEIDHNYDERRVHRKTKSQRDKRGHIIHKLYTTGGLSSILKELSDDIVPADGEEIYNPFTPVVSPTDDMPTHIDKMFLQTSSGYRPVERCYYKHPFGSSCGGNSGGHRATSRGRSRIRGGGVGGIAAHIAINGIGGVGGGGGNGDGLDYDDDVDDDDGGVGIDIEGRHYAGIGGAGGGGSGCADGLAHINRNYCDTHYLLAAEYERYPSPLYDDGSHNTVPQSQIHSILLALDQYGNRTSKLPLSYAKVAVLCEASLPAISTNIHLACVVQRIWHLISNICHGLIAGLALAHLILVLSSQPADWQVFHSLIDNTESTVTATNANVMNATKMGTPPTIATSPTPTYVSDGALALSHYATFADVYLNTFYCLALLCLISVFDRMDISNWHMSAHAVEFISFRWLVIAMIYIVTIILTICSTTIDGQLYYSTDANVTLTQTEVLVRSVHNLWNSLAVTRSIAAICGWILIGTTPQKDMLYEHLVDLSAYQMTNN